MEIIKDFISAKYYRMIPEYITIHETGNYDNGASAEMHSKYLKSINTDNKCWHFTVDENVIYQHIPITYNGWHSTDGHGDGNRKSIGIEMCVNVDGDYEKTLQNTIWLCKKLIKENPSIKDVVQHNHWYNKNCPRKLRDSGRWQWFKNEVYNIEETIPSWKYDGIEKLNKLGILDDIEGWKNKIDEPMPTWAVTILLSKLADKMK